MQVCRGESCAPRGSARDHPAAAHRAPSLIDSRVALCTAADMLTTTDCIDIEGDVHGGCWHVDHNTGALSAALHIQHRCGPQPAPPRAQDSSTCGLLPSSLSSRQRRKQKIETSRDIMVRDQASTRENSASPRCRCDASPMHLPVRRQRSTCSCGRASGRSNGPLRRTRRGAFPSARCTSRGTISSIARLPLRYFANGHTFFVQRIYAKSEHSAAFRSPYDVSVRRLVEVSVRQAAADARGPCVAGGPAVVLWRGRYLAVAPEAAALPIDYLSRECTTADAADRFNKEDAHLRVVLRDALALAIALNRTLVLPRMLCYCDNIWKEMKHCRVGGAFGMTLPFDCPADHIMNLASWCAPRRPPPNPARAPLNPSLPFARFDTDVPIGFREPLSHRPEALARNRLVVGAPRGTSHDGRRGCGQVGHPRWDRGARALCGLRSLLRVRGQASLSHPQRCCIWFASTPASVCCEQLAPRRGAGISRRSSIESRRGSCHTAATSATRTASRWPGWHSVLLAVLPWRSLAGIFLASISWGRPHFTPMRGSSLLSVRTARKSRCAFRQVAGPPIIQM